MSARWQENEVLMDLLIKEATEGLTAEESARLAALLREVPAAERSAMERTVAALFAAGAGKPEAMPAGLKDRILANAPGKAGAASTAQVSAGNVTPFPGRSTRRGGMSPAAGWWAAAASLVLAIAGWWPRIVGDHAPPPPVAEVTAEAARKAMLAEQSTLQVSLTAASDKPLTGDVVFDPVRQVGFLRFQGIPANDPRLAQYQLWIADAGRKQPEPVDGGVFDVTPQATASGDVIIPFRAKLPVGKAAAFVVTMEQPGGVVVSKQERVLALAKVPNGT